MEGNLEDNLEGSTLSQFPLRFSLFPNVPPYLRILSPDEHYSPPFPSELQQLTWAAPGGVSTVVLDCVRQAGWLLVKGQVRRKEDLCTGSIWDCLPITEKAKDEIYFAGLNEEVKINQFPGLFVIGRKDCLWTSYQKMVQQFGEEQFGFLPRTFIVPQDQDQLVQVMQENKRTMIIKPPNWFCGIGIKLINKIEDIPCKQSKMVVQEYIDNPFLINGLKFDLRLYILLTSIDPVKLYIYEDGLVRFATVQYSNDPAQLGNNMIHLTNYSINKTSNQFVNNEIPGEYTGHKWNLKTLWKYLEEELGLDWRPVWEATKDICVKTVLCGHEHMKTQAAEQIQSEYNCYKLWGFDVFLDADLKPWLLEVNNIPSLYVDTIDAFVNRPMVAEMFNIVGFHIPKAIASKHQKAVKQKLNLKDFKSKNIGHDPKVYSKLRIDEDDIKTNKFTSEHYLGEILENLSPSDVRNIIRSEDELSQAKVWTRIFPTPDTHPYLQFLSSPCYSDQLLNAWEEKFGACQADRREGQDMLRKLCEEKHHLKLPEIVTNSPPSAKLAEPRPRNQTSAWIDIEMFHKFQ